MMFHKIPDYFFLVLLSGFTILFSIFGDRNLRHNRNNVSRAIIDNLTHSILGGFSWIIILVLRKKCLIQNLFSIVLCFMISSLIDIDHFLSAKSYKLQDATQLNHRPFLHCTTLSIFMFVILILLSKFLNSSNLNELAWIILVSFLSHHVRDAHRHGLWIEPLGCTPPLPQYVYLSLELVLPYIIHALMILFGSIDHKIDKPSMSTVV